MSQQIMKDKWINVGYESDELKPHTEPEEDFSDTSRVGEKRPQMRRVRNWLRLKTVE